MQSPVRGFLETSGLVTGAGELLGAEHSLPPEKFLPPPLLHFILEATWGAGRGSGHG